MADAASILGIAKAEPGAGGSGRKPREAAAPKPKGVSREARSPFSGRAFPSLLS